MSKIYFIDTCFLINLLSEDRPFYNQAQRIYWQLYNTPNVQIKISSLALAEYMVKGDIKFVPSTIEVQPFNTLHAIKSGEFGRICAYSRKEVGDRIILLNDSKLFAQAEQEGAVGFITADRKAQKAYDILNDSGVVSFDFHNMAQ